MLVGNMSNGNGDATQCTSCAMYAFLGQLFKGEYCAKFSKLFPQKLRSCSWQTLLSIIKLKGSSDHAHQVLARASIEGVVR